GAYRVTLEDGAQITFLDTPGHAAFTSMRSRGAHVTDIAVIVVAADDGVMPQTIEAISHAKAAKVPIIVALNKMDKPGVNPDRIKQALTEYELVPEEWGGNTIYVPVSAMKKTGIKELLEQIHLVAEVQELKANATLPGKGVVIESKLEKGRGVVATILVQDGTMKQGQPIVAGQAFGKIRAMLDENGKPLKEAGPGWPVQILGLSEAPQAGDKADICDDEGKARAIASVRKQDADKGPQSMGPKMTLEDLFSKVKMGETKELLVVLKADVAGSMEALKSQLEQVGTDEVKVRVIHSALGGVTESDVLLASTAKGIVIGFGVRPDTAASNAASNSGVEVKTYNIIYELLDDVKKAMSGLLTPEVVEKVLGRVEVRNVFTIPKAGTIAGSYVVEGKVTRQSMLRLVRDGKVVYEGKVGSLKRFKDDAKEVQTGFECGISIEGYNDVKVGDVIEAFERQSIARQI
ncbi:MAG: translation initiation factor IF-2, partial [Bdellovibrionales bacterium]|nr:translation initiation factor IF-2 [Bdellovibrionales bacterium]